MHTLSSTKRLATNQKSIFLHGEDHFQVDVVSLRSPSCRELVSQNRSVCNRKLWRLHFTPLLTIIAFRLEGCCNLKYLKILAKNPFYHFIKIKLGSCINWVCNYAAPK